MNQIFISIFNNAIITSFLILAIILIRLIFKRVPKWINCLLWGLVAIKLVMPFSIESALSLIPSAKPVPANIEYVASPKLETGVQVVNQVINPVIEANFTPDPVASVNPMQVAISILSVIWIVGFMSLALYSLISFLLLRRKVSVSVNSSENVYVCDEVESPFILGIIRPRIYLPTGLSEDTMECVLQHEKAHLKRKDHFWKPLGFLILSVYWFNPLCWVAYVLLCKDIELACDEKVTKDKDTQWKRLYCQSLLDCSVRRRTITACPVAFGEVGVKDRVKSVINYKKPTFWIILVAIVVIVVVVVCFMTNPRSEEVRNDDGIINDDGNDIGIVNDVDSDVTNDEIVEKDEKLSEAARNWAQAFVKKDGQTIVKMSTQEVIDGFERRDYLERHGDMVIFGNSDINLEWENFDSYMIVNQDDENHTADILYYAYTSDLLVTVWKERVTFTPRLTEYVVSDETLVILDTISTSEEFLSAYPLPRGIYRTPMDYSFSGYGEALNEKALLSSSLLYKDLFEPEGALRHLLNLTEDEKKVRIERVKTTETNVVELEVTFLKDNYSATFNMVRLWGESGIWIPQDFDISHVDFAGAGTNDLTLSELNKICNSPNFVSDIEKEGVTYFAKYSNFVEDKSYPKETAGNGLCLAELSNGDKTYNLFVLFFAEEYAKEKNNVANRVDLVYLSDGEKDIYLYIADKEKRNHVDTDITSFIGGVYELGEQKMLSIEELNLLCNSESFVKDIEEQGISYFDKYSNLETDEEFNKGSLTNIYSCNYVVNDVDYRLDIYYWPVEDKVDNIWLGNSQTGDGILLYTAEENRKQYVNTDIVEFLGRKYGLDSEISINSIESKKLKSRVELQQYNMDMYLNFEGNLFTSSDYIAPKHGESCPESWFALGGIGKCKKEYCEDFAIFEENHLVEYNYIDNHMGCEKIKNFDTEDFNCVLYKYNQNVFTMPEGEEAGISEDEYNVDNWVAFFTPKNGGDMYMEFFNCDYFTQEEAIKNVSAIRLK